MDQLARLPFPIAGPSLPCCSLVARGDRRCLSRGPVVGAHTIPFVSPALANLACVGVRWENWPAAVGSAAYLITRRSYFVGILALCWPTIACFVCVPGRERWVGWNSPSQRRSDMWNRGKGPDSRDARHRTPAGSLPSKEPKMLHHR